MLKRFLNDYQKHLDDVEKQLTVFKQEYELKNEAEDVLNDFEQEYRLLPKEPQKPYTFLRFLNEIYDEKSYSNILAYFLDPANPHGLGRTILDSFLCAIGFESPKPEEVKIYTEYRLLNGRVADLVIDSAFWTIVIENKISSPESQEQTNDLYKGIKIDEKFKDKEKRFIFLTPEGQRPRNRNFKPLKYKELLENIEKQTQTLLFEVPVSTTIHLSDFLRTIKEELMQEKMKNETFSKKSMLYLKHYKEIEDVRRSFEEDIKTFGERWPKLLIKEYGLNEEEWDSSTKETHAQFYKKNWAPAKPFIHFEFWINLEDTGLMYDSVPFMVDVEGKKKEDFFKVFDRSKSKIEKSLREKRIQYRPAHRSVALAYKEYSLQGDPNNLLKVIVQAFGEFRFLIEYIDKILAKL